jgi:thioredoxin 1
MAIPIDVSDKTFQHEVLDSETPVLVDFWAEWCPPCHMLAPVIEEIANEHGDRARFAKLDVDGSPVTAGRFGVRSLPTMIVFKAGREVERIVGYQLKPQLMKKLAPHFS